VDGCVRVDGDSAPRHGLSDDEIALLYESQRDKRKQLRLVVTGCAYSCCGKGWHRRDGYEQTYTGWIDNLRQPDGAGQGTLMLYAAGLGTVSYVIAARWDEVELVERA
jgi:hypothetical protein